MATKGKYIIFFGGGRWSRVLISAALQVIPNYTKLLVFSPRNTKGMREWAKANNLSSRIIILEDLNLCSPSEIYAAIVVNAAKDHKSSVKWCLENTIPTLVEKPLALDLESAIDLEKLSIKKNTLLAPAHIFLYTGYLDNFRKKITNTNDIEYVILHWIDPILEERYGEKKSYDSSITIFQDLMPHILSIIQFFLPDSNYKFEKLELTNGGSSIQIHICAGKIPCMISLVRNGTKRQRSVAIKTIVDKKLCELDFSSEPGIIKSELQNEIGDPNWSKKEKPSISMLNSFFDAIEGKSFDSRLEISLAIKSCKLVDEILPVYENEQYKWIINKIGKENYSGIYYTFEEIFGRINKKI